MSLEASGRFEVRMNPETGADAAVGRFTLGKTYFGGLDATSVGEMLAVGTETKGSAGYVAMERVTGRLNGEEGSFALLHSGIMNRGVPTLSVVIVPDSGTGALKTIAGSLLIEISGGVHTYVLRYSLT